ncbi:hypothetical protein GQ457_11G026820 [Hibiscus cannabinus]
MFVKPICDLDLEIDSSLSSSSSLITSLLIMLVMTCTLVSGVGSLEMHLEAELHIFGRLIQKCLKHVLLKIVAPEAPRLKEIVSGWKEIFRDKLNRQPMFNLEILYNDLEIDSSLSSSSSLITSLLIMLVMTCTLVSGVGSLEMHLEAELHIFGRLIQSNWVVKVTWLRMMGLGLGESGIGGKEEVDDDEAGKKKENGKKEIIHRCKGVAAAQGG